MGNFSNVIAVIILGVIAVIILFSSLPRIDRFLAIKSVEVCSNSAHIIQKNQDGSVIQYPHAELYADCLSETK